MTIENVRYESNFDSHTNSARTIIALLNGEMTDFIPSQIRVVQFKETVEAGNHWREYPELYGLIGEAKFTVEDIESKERRNYDLKTGDRLLIPPRVAVKVQALEVNTVIVVCSPKSDREEETHKYEIR